MDKSEAMRRVRSKNTKPELRLRRKLLDAGLRGYRLHWGKFHIDVAFTRNKVAIFYDSCFWHGCPKHGKLPKTNQAFWLRKLENNICRDKYATSQLKKDGWVVIRIWGHSLEDFDPLGMPALAGLSR